MAKLIPPFLLKLMNTVRDVTLDRTCYLWTRNASVGIDPEGTYPEEGWGYLGMYTCRIDSMEAKPMADGANRRFFAFTLPADAPKLLHGDLVRIDDIDYHVDGAEDEMVELIIRRYTISLALRPFLAKKQAQR